MSKDNYATLAKVVPRWLYLEEELRTLAQVYLYLEPVLALSGIFDTRLKAQTEPIH
jgi:hypothetical protein